jgi:hypothetical protein
MTRRWSRRDVWPLALLAAAGCFHDFAFLDASRDGAPVDVRDPAVDAADVAVATDAVDRAQPPHDAPAGITCSPDASARCPACDLGSAVGDYVATGTNGSAPSQLVPTIMCTNPTPENPGIGQGAEVTFRWTAPSQGVWRFDTFGTTYDSVIYVIDHGEAGCDGTQLVCSDDRLSGPLAGCTATTLAAGQTVIIVLDAWGVGVMGTYALSIGSGTAAPDGCP